MFSCSLRPTLFSGDWGLLKTNQTWTFDLDIWVDAGVGAANNDIDWLMCFVVVESSTDSSVHSLETWENCLLLWRKFDRRLGLLYPCVRKNDGFVGLGEAVELTHHWRSSLLSSRLLLIFRKQVSIAVTQVVFSMTLKSSWCHRVLEWMIDSIDHHRRECWLPVPTSQDETTCLSDVSWRSVYY